MSTSDSSTSARRDGSARDAVESAAYDITDAIEALTSYLDIQRDIEDSAGVADIFRAHEQSPTLGHLRAILAALSAPYVPGMVHTDKATWSQAIADDEDAAITTLWVNDQAVDSWFIRPAVTR